MRKSKRRKRTIIVVILFLFIFLAIFFIMFEIRLSEIVVDIAEQKVKSEASLIISREINDEIQNSGITYDSLVTLEKDSEGKITALKTNIIEVNRLKASLSLGMLEKLNKNNEMSVVVPIGSIFNSQILSGYGPKVNVRVIPVGSAAIDITNEITSAGINQTRHQIMLSVNIQLAVISAAKRISTDVATNVCVAETVIVGSVPESYTNIDASSKNDNDDNSLDPDTLFNFVY